MFLLTRLQHIIQGKLQPAASIEYFSSNHTDKRLFLCDKSSRDVFRLLSKRIESEKINFIVVESSERDLKIVLHKFSTILQFLSRITISIVDSKGANNNIGSSIWVHSVSTSILPTFIPFGFLIAFLLIWIPFSDSNANTYYIDELERRLLYTAGRRISAHSSSSGVRGTRLKGRRSQGPDTDPEPSIRRVESIGRMVDTDTEALENKHSSNKKFFFTEFADVNPNFIFFFCFIIVPVVTVFSLLLLT
jgi:hypothetical protein